MTSEWPLETAGMVEAVELALVPLAILGPVTVLGLVSVGRFSEPARDANEAPR